MPHPHARAEEQEESLAMSTRSNRWLLGFALAGLMFETIVSHPALATDKVSLFKVITAKDEIVIGMTDDELAKLQSKTAGGELLPAHVGDRDDFQRCRVGLHAKRVVRQQADLAQWRLFQRAGLGLAHRILPHRDGAAVSTRCLATPPAVLLCSLASWSSLIPMTISSFDVMTLN